MTLLRNLVIVPIAAIAGAVIGMHGYLNSIPERVSTADRERIMYIAAVPVGISSAFLAAATLAVSSMFPSRADKERDRLVIGQFIRSQANRKDLPASDRAHWIDAYDQWQHHSLEHRPTPIKFPFNSGG